MPLPLPRFRIRTLMIAVAVTGIALSIPGFLQRRRVAFLALAKYHDSMATKFGVSELSFRIIGGRKYPSGVVVPFSESEKRVQIRRGFYYHGLRAKYRRAAARPWLPVPPDPPMPTP